MSKGKGMRFAREALGIKQADMARQLGVYPQQIVPVENGDKPGEKIVEGFSKKTGIPGNTIEELGRMIDQGQEPRMKEHVRKGTIDMLIFLAGK